MILMTLTNKSLEILKSFRTKQNIHSVANRFDTYYDVIRNNHFKYFWKEGYLNRVGRGYYIISRKGKWIIKRIKILNKIDAVILEEAKKGRNNKEIINLIREMYCRKLSYPSIYSKIYRLRKKYNFHDRRKNYIKIPTNFSEELAELLGLIFSDGYISKYSVCFYNTSKALLIRFEHLVNKLFGLSNPLKRTMQSGAIEINFRSIELYSYLYMLIENKSKIPKEILNGDDETKIAFLRGYFSGDGGVCLSIWKRKSSSKFEFAFCVFLACKKRKNILLLSARILKSLGIECRIQDGVIYVSSWDGVYKFSERVRFIENCIITKNSKIWNGFEKNQVLDYIVNHLRYNKRLKELAHGNKKEIVEYIKNNL